MSVQFLSSKVESAVNSHGLLLFANVDWLVDEGFLVTLVSLMFLVFEV